MSRDGDRPQYRGPLAGVTAGAIVAGVLSVGGLIMVWHRIQGPVGTMALVICGAITALAVAVAAYGVWRLFVLGLLHVREPETARFTVRRAEVPHPNPPVIQSQPVAELGAGGTVIHNHFDGADAAVAALRALQGPSDAPR